jgi:hypothetical protein
MAHSERCDCATRQLDLKFGDMTYPSGVDGRPYSSLGNLPFPSMTQDSPGFPLHKAPVCLSVSPGGGGLPCEQRSNVRVLTTGSASAGSRGDLRLVVCSRDTAIAWTVVCGEGSGKTTL